MMLLKMILLPFLLAMFSRIATKMENKSDVLWKFQRYNLIVKFSVLLNLPPPLNVLNLIILLYQSITSCCRKICCIEDQTKPKEIHSEYDEMPEFEASYWRMLSEEYWEKLNYTIYEAEYLKNESDIISKLTDDVRQNEMLINQTQCLIAQLEAELGHARISSGAYQELETGSIHDEQKTVKSAAMFLHSLSRMSPYQGTRIQRYPVPDKYVPWEVMWFIYEPTFYTAPNSEFPLQLQPYVDEDSFSLHKRQRSSSFLSMYKWNMEHTDSDGTYTNRESWMVDNQEIPLKYRIKDGLPMNPMGRTGMYGKGALPRFGPNHNVFVVITRWYKELSKSSGFSLFDTDNLLEFVGTWLTGKKEITLPGAFAWGKSRYLGIQSIFQMDDDSSDTWETSDDMINFFKRHVVVPENQDAGNYFEYRKVECGYMDDPLNTDQAWKEVELWHVHYLGKTNLHTAFQGSMQWRILSEDVFLHLPYGQTLLLQNALKSLEAK